MEPTSEQETPPPDSDESQQDPIFGPIIPYRVPYPLFAKTIFILDAFLCGSRVILVPLAAWGLIALKQQQDPNLGWAIGESGTNLCLLVFGVPAAIALLFKKRWGLVLAALTIIASLASMGFGVWRASTVRHFTVGSLEALMVAIGSGCNLLIRIVLLLSYVAALFQFEKWSREHDQQAQPPCGS